MLSFAAGAQLAKTVRESGHSAVRRTFDRSEWQRKKGPTATIYQ
jgi:hypothetical protein